MTQTRLSILLLGDCGTSDDEDSAGAGRPPARPDWASRNWRGVIPTVALNWRLVFLIGRLKLASQHLRLLAGSWTVSGGRSRDRDGSWRPGRYHAR